MAEIGYHWRPLMALDRPAEELAAPEVRAWTPFWRGVVDELKEHHPAEAKRLLRLSARLAGFDPRFAPELASRPLDAALIRDLHIRATRSQATVAGISPAGEPVHMELAHGRYKRRPNNPIRPDGKIHEWCPWEQVPERMQTLFRTWPTVPRDYPEVRAAFALHRLIHIHPFEDGNGRVARLLCTKGLLEAGLPPFVLDESERNTRYVPILNAIHETNNLFPLVRFVVHRLRWSLVRLLSERDPHRDGRPGLTVGLRVATALREARTGRRAEARARLQERLGHLSIAVQGWAEAHAAELSEATGSPVRVGAEPLGADERGELVTAAHRAGLRPDVAEPFHTSRVHLGGRVPTSLTLVWFPIGRPSAGAASAMVRVQERDGGAWRDAGLTLRAPPSPLVVPSEPLDAQQHRLTNGWAQSAVAAGLRAWGSVQ